MLRMGMFHCLPKRMSKSLANWPRPLNATISELALNNFKHTRSSYATTTDRSTTLPTYKPTTLASYSLHKERSSLPDFFYPGSLH